MEYAGYAAEPADARIGPNKGGDALSHLNGRTGVAVERIMSLTHSLTLINDYLGGPVPEADSNLNTVSREPNSAIEALNHSVEFVHRALNDLEQQVARLGNILGR